MFRHGVRSPMELGTFPNDPNKEKYKELAGGRSASLTDIGKQQMYGVGLSLRQRYGQFINGYQEDKVKVTSSTTSRTIMSAKSVAAAMLPPTTRIFRKLAWQPVPVSLDTNQWENAFGFLDKTPSDCPTYWTLASESKFYSQDTRLHYKHIYSYVQQHAGDTNINKPSQLYDIFDTLYFANRNGLQLPEWTTTPQLRFSYRPLFPDMLIPFYIQFMQSNMYFRRNEDMLRIFSGPLLNIISSSLLKISSAPSSPDRFWYHSTHDTTIYHLLRALKVDDPLTAEPGDGVIFELHKEKGEEYVKIFMYNCIPNTMKELNSPLCPKPCTLDMFTSNLKGLTPDEWNEHCGK